MIREILKRRESQILLSFVLGLGLSVLMFHRRRLETEVSALTPSEIKNKVFNIDGKCYKFEIRDASCPSMRLSL